MTVKKNQFKPGLGKYEKNGYQLYLSFFSLKLTALIYWPTHSSLFTAKINFPEPGQHLFQVVIPLHFPEEVFRKGG